jgi:hypothetical protein
MSSVAFSCPEKIHFEKETCNTEYSMDLLLDQYQDLLDEEFFSSLRGTNISIVSFKSDAYYLATGIKKIFKNKRNREYTIRINEALFDCAPTDRAMKAILAHELVHIKDYVRKGTLGMLGFGVGYLIAPAKKERSTDYRVLKEGYVNGISEYREWIYPKLSVRDLKRKKKRYYTPEEIDVLVDNGTFEARD